MSDHFNLYLPHHIKPFLELFDDHPMRLSSYISSEMKTFSLLSISISLQVRRRGQIGENVRKEVLTEVIPHQLEASYLFVIKSYVISSVINPI